MTQHRQSNSPYIVAIEELVACSIRYLLGNRGWTQGSILLFTRLKQLDVEKRSDDMICIWMKKYGHRGTVHRNFLVRVGSVKTIFDSPRQKVNLYI